MRKFVFVFFLVLLWIHQIFCSIRRSSIASDCDTCSLISDGSNLSRSSSTTSVWVGGFETVAPSANNLSIFEQQNNSTSFAFLGRSYEKKLSDFFDTIVNVNDLTKIFGHGDYNVQITASLQTRMKRLGKSFEIDLLTAPGKTTSELAPFLEFKTDFYKIFGRNSGDYSVKFPPVKDNLQAWNSELAQEMASNIAKVLETPDAKIDFSAILAFTIDNFNLIFSFLKPPIPTEMRNKFFFRELVLLDREQFCFLVRRTQLWQDRMQYPGILSLLFNQVHFSWFIESADIFGLDNKQGTVFSIYAHLSRKLYCLSPENWKFKQPFQEFLHEIGGQILHVFNQTPLSSAAASGDAQWNHVWNKQLYEPKSSSSTARKLLSKIKRASPKFDDLSEYERRILLLNLNWGLFLSEAPSTEKELMKFLKFPLVFCKPALERFLTNYWRSGRLYSDWERAFDRKMGLSESAMRKFNFYILSFLPDCFLLEFANQWSKRELKNENEKAFDQELKEAISGIQSPQASELELNRPFSSRNLIDGNYFEFENHDSQSQNSSKIHSAQSHLSVLPEEDEE